MYFDQQTGAPHAYSWSKSFVSAWKQAVFCCFLHFFPFMTEKEGKIREKLVLTPKNDFDQRTGCRAPVGWSKYTTVVIDTSLTPGNQDQARIWIWNKVDKETTLVFKAIFRSILTILIYWTIYFFASTIRYFIMLHFTLFLCHMNSVGSPLWSLTYQWQFQWLSGLRWR